ncbi:hypothetical protein ScPMuIL_013927 [Solemya velum]
MYPQTPTNPDVVKTSLDYFVSLNLKLGLSKTNIICDQAIYKIIKGLVKKGHMRYKDVILRLDGFHIVQNLLGSIAFFVRESGKDVLVAADICGCGTANKVVARKYYKMIQYHFWLGKAFFILKWGAFEQWLLDIEQNNHIESLSTVSVLLERIRTDCGQQDKNSVVQNVSRVLENFHSLLIVSEEFEDSLGKTTKLWGMYNDMVLVFNAMSMLNESTLEGNTSSKPEISCHTRCHRDTILGMKRSR